MPRHVTSCHMSCHVITTHHTTQHNSVLLHSLTLSYLLYCTALYCLQVSHMNRVIEHVASVGSTLNRMPKPPKQPHQVVTREQYFLWSKPLELRLLGEVLSAVKSGQPISRDLGKSYTATVFQGIQAALPPTRMCSVAATTLAGDRCLDTSCTYDSCAGNRFIVCADVYAADEDEDYAPTPHTAPQVCNPYMISTMLHHAAHVRCTSSLSCTECRTALLS